MKITFIDAKFPSQKIEAAVGTVAEIIGHAANLNGEVKGEIVLPNPERIARWWPDTVNAKRVRFIVDLSATESYFGTVILE